MKIVHVVHDVQEVKTHNLVGFLPYNTDDFVRKYYIDILKKSRDDQSTLSQDGLDIDSIIRNTISTFLEVSLKKGNDKIEETISLDSAKTKYYRTTNLSIGTYTLHPYDGDRLSRLESYHKNLALDKDNELIVLLGRMGAKNVRIVETGNQKKSGSVNVEVDTLKAGIDTTITSSKETDQEKELIVSFEGNIIDIDQNLLKSSLWFSNDSQVNAIFESRKFTPNKIQKYTLRNTYTETFDFDFDLAAKFLTIKADLKGEYAAISKKERLFYVEFGT